MEQEPESVGGKDTDPPQDPSGARSPARVPPEAISPHYPSGTESPARIPPETISPPYPSGAESPTRVPPETISPQDPSGAESPARVPPETISPPDPSGAESPARVVPETIPDEVADSGGVLEENEKEPPSSSTPDEKTEEDVDTDLISEIPATDTRREGEEIVELQKDAETEKLCAEPLEVPLPAEKEETLTVSKPAVELADEQNLESADVPEVETPSEAAESPDGSKELALDRSEVEEADKTIDETNQPEAITSEPVESTSKEVPEAAEEDESFVEATPADNPIVDKPSNQTSDEAVDVEAPKEVESPTIEPSAQSKCPDSEALGDSIDPPEPDSKKSTEESKSDTDSLCNEADSTSKEIATEKQIVEPENTEFVQISQDKQDEGVTIEGQNIEAEDPFGGDNLTGDSVEQTDVDSPAMDDVNFHKLGDQAVNLQDVVNAKDQGTGEFEDSNLEDALETSTTENVDTPEASAEIVAADVSEMGAEIDEGSKSDNLDGKDKAGTEVSEATEKSSDEKNSGEAMSVDSSNEAPDEEDHIKKKTVNLPMETEESQSDVLPGQDDELCIIPDSMKETTATGSRPEAAKDAEETAKDAPEDKSTEAIKDSEVQVEKEITQPKELEIISSTDVAMPLVSNEFTDSGPDKERKDNRTTNEKKSSAQTTDVIDVDEEPKASEIDEMTIGDDMCKQCNERKPCGINVKVGADTYSVCSQACKDAFTGENNKSMDIPSDAVNSKREKRCASCLLIVETGDDRNLSWETMEFCNEECLGKFQTKYGSYCRNCNGSVQPISLGKYCVRFGYDVRQFCCSSCLEEFKKGLKVCSYCQKDISSGIEGFLAPVGDKGQFKDFCTQYCMEKYSRMNSNEPPVIERKSCSVCQEVKVVHCEVQIDRASPVAICGDPCFAAFKFVNKVDPEQCSTCKKFFELANKKSFVVFHEGEAHTFCTKTCLNIFIITNRKIVPCNWCKVKKYNFDMIKKDLKTGQALMMCSLNCLTLYQVSVNAVSARRISCDFCKEFSQAQYHLTMSDATIRNFCSYNCVMKFQGQYTKSPITIPAGDDPVPTGMPKRTYPPAKGLIQSVQKANDPASKKAMPVISSVTSLASLTTNGQVTQAPQPQQTTLNNVNVAANVVTSQSQTPQVIVNQQVIARPPSPVKIHNKNTQCKPLTHTKGVSVRPHPCFKSTQTEGEARVLIPIPVPIYVPYPVHMWSMPFPVPVPFPLPIPVPIFIPTTRNSAKGILKDIKRIQEKIPADPFEAELLMMAEMVATEKKTNESDSDSSDDNGRDTAEAVDSSNTFGEDMLQMALKMATGELDEPAVDLETALTPNTITATQTTSQTDSAMSTDVQPERNVTASNRGKKRMVPYKPRGAPSKRGRRISGVHDAPMMPPPESQPPSQPRMMEPIEKPDANMALKYTFGVNAWRQWVIAKNAELEKQVTPPRKVKLFKTDLLQLTADELNYTLCLFVKEVRKPNGAEYAPDTIYYLCLGIQQYLFENNRIDNIFTDSYYEKFTDCLNDVAKKFSVLYNDAQYIVTRVEEEHLWECKQLGAHSPHVLLSTLMFFNTKHFNLVTVEEHMQLSFSHIMKHWKRNPAAQAAAAAVAGKGPGTRNVLLRFYPPQSALEANSRKKKVYEQQENEENPLRCPVKLYEFYLSKCPESVKTRNDVFYLLPERSCVPDSPVWYSTSALAKEHLVKMLYRVKMVKEINVALLTS